MGLVNHYMSLSVVMIDALIDEYSAKPGERFELAVRDLIEAKRLKLARIA